MTAATPGPDGSEVSEDQSSVPPPNAAAEAVDGGSQGAESDDPLGPPAGASGEGGAPPVSHDSVEDVIALLEQTTTERNEYLDALRRSQADFENYRKRAAKQIADDAARAVESLVEKLLPVLDACDAAVHHGATEVEPVYAALLGTLEKEGLARLAPHGEEFDPTVHEAVMHEPADDNQDGTVVSDVMRAGYLWNGRVVRPAMVKVKG